MGTRRALASEAKKQQIGTKYQQPIKRGHYHSKTCIAKIVEKMKKALQNGMIIKVVVWESGYELRQGMALFKRKTGMTMRQYQMRCRSKP
jgi:transcriptional regulator GlxA family with amidase domain